MNPSDTDNQAGHCAMSLTPEQQRELTKFPTALRALIEAELAAGNAIEEVGYRFPASPAGVFFKLAKQVSTRRRAMSPLAGWRSPLNRRSLQTYR
jgi:hypothetical protein